MSGRNSGGSVSLVHRLEDLDPDKGAILYCAVDPTEKILATCSVVVDDDGKESGKIILWDIATGKMSKTLTHTGAVTSCAFCSFGPILASTTRDNKVILWHHEKGKRASKLELHSDWVLHCAFSKDGKLLGSASRDKTARVYKIKPGAGEFVFGGEIKQLVGHTAGVNVIQFSPDGALILTGSDDRTIRAWRPGKDDNWNCVTTLSKFTAPIKSVIFSPVDPAFVSLASPLDAGSKKGSRVTKWTMHGSSYDAENSVDINVKTLKAISFNPDGRYIVGVASDATINVWDSVQNGGWSTWSTRPKEDDLGKAYQHDGVINACCFATEERFITADDKGVALVWCWPKS